MYFQYIINNINKLFVDDDVASIENLLPKEISLIMSTSLICKYVSSVFIQENSDCKELQLMCATLFYNMLNVHNNVHSDPFCKLLFRVEVH